MKTKAFLVILAGFLCVNIFGQTDINGQADVGGTQTDVLQKICLSKDGGFLITGYSVSNHSPYKTENRRGDYDYWVIKFDKAKNIQWDKTIGGNRADYLSTAVAAKDGGYLLAGGSSSGISGEKTGANLGQSDYWLVKIDANGNIQWDKTMGTIYSDGVTSIDETKDGGYILLGSLGLTKIDSIGNVQWQNEAITTDIGYNSVQQISGGNFLLAGSKYVFRHDTLLMHPILLATDSSGNKLFEKSFTSGQHIYDGSYSAQQTSDGGAILYGLAYVNLNKVYQGSADIIKTDNHGKLQWRYTTNDFDSFYRGSRIVVQETIDGYIFAGTYHPYSLIEDQHKDYFIGKLDIEGNKEWYQIIVADNEDDVSDLQRSGKDHYLIAGSSWSGVGGDKTKRTLGNSDYWILAVTDTASSNVIAKNITATSSHAKEINGVTVYPNPVKDILYIQATGKASYTLTDQSGKGLLTKTIVNKGDINIAYLSAGLYFLKNNKTGKVQKIIISK